MSGDIAHIAETLAAAERWLTALEDLHNCMEPQVRPRLEAAVETYRNALSVYIAVALRRGEDK